MIPRDIVLSECYKAFLDIESRDPMIIPNVINALSELLSTSCDKTSKTPSWSVHACGKLLVKVTPLFPGSEKMPLSRPIVRVGIEGSDPASLAEIISLILEELDRRFPGQVYSRLSP